MGYQKKSGNETQEPAGVMENRLILYSSGDCATNQFSAGLLTETNWQASLILIACC